MTKTEFNAEELLRWLYKREGEMESKKERTKDTFKKAIFGCQAKAYKEVQNFVEQRIKSLTTASTTPEREPR